jgi:hypothetical protein
MIFGDPSLPAARQDATFTATASTLGVDRRASIRRWVSRTGDRRWSGGFAPTHDVAVLRTAELARAVDEFSVTVISSRYS